MARELAELRTRRANLEGHRADLERRTRAAESRAVLGALRPRLLRPAAPLEQLQLLEGRRWAEEARAQRTEHGATLGRAGATLQVGAVALKIGTPGPQLGELARHGERRVVARDHDPGDREKPDQPYGQPVPPLKPHRSPRRRGTARCGPAGSPATRSRPAVAPSWSAHARAAAPGTCTRAGAAGTRTPCSSRGRRASPCDPRPSHS